MSFCPSHSLGSLGEKFKQVKVVEYSLCFTLGSLINPSKDCRAFKWWKDHVCVILSSTPGQQELCEL